jgi:hypothetical protein
MGVWGRLSLPMGVWGQSPHKNLKLFKKYKAEPWALPKPTREIISLDPLVIEAILAFAFLFILIRCFF